MRPDGKPFRWNMSNPSLTKRLKAGESQLFEDHDIDRLLRCGASTLRVGDCDIVFVGRSLESLFDLLCGALSRTTWYDRLQLLQMSVRGSGSVDAIRSEINKHNERFRWRKQKSADDRIESLASYFRHCHLWPEQILKRDRRITFVDIVASGGTFGALFDLLKSYCGSSVEWQSVAKRINVVVVQPEPGTMDEPIWNPCDSKWTIDFPDRIQQISMNVDLWFFLADEQFKTIHWNPPICWGDKSEPPQYDWDFYAARGSRKLYRRGERSRRRLASLLDEAPEPIDAIKSLATELRRESRFR